MIPEVQADIEHLVNYHGLDAATGIPDFVLAQMILRYIETLKFAKSEKERLEAFDGEEQS